MNDERDEDLIAPDMKGVGGEMVVQGLIALGFGVPGPLAFVTAFAPLAARALGASVLEITRPRARRVGAMLEAATTEAGGVEALASLISVSEEAQELAYETAEAATRSRVPEAVVVMGRALVQGLLADGTKIEESRHLIDALASLTPPHARILEVLGAMDEVATVDALADRVGEWRQILPRLLAGLESEGLARQATATGGTTWGDLKDGRAEEWQLTAFGRRALAMLQEVGSAPE
ncbi:hypothetical protein ACFWGN_20815 [Oerskovia sp. NPDC060338]|uniref:hypothetical protein n=1 Tax=Oerskovia sp. NPDC060338 TaxID=3347100 RepID=UPI0036467FEF